MQEEEEDQINDKLALCNAQDYLKYSKFKTILLLNSTYDISFATKCKQNCKVFKYELAKKLEWTVQLQYPTIKIMWLNKELSLETEVLAYDVLTFVANFGGTLGLFVGFSFFMLWDLLLPLFERCKLLMKFK